MSTNQSSRRTFIKQSGAGAAALAAAPAVLAAGPSPNDVIRVGCIGLGVRGGTLNRLVTRVEGVRVDYVCDVYKPHVEKGVRQSQNPNIKTTVDYQEVLADKDIDAVVIATPDHWHSKMLIDAANAGKDVYIEKGWTRTIAEAKAMREAVKKNNIVMQLGHQSRAQPAGVQARELIEQGILGPITLVRVGRMENNPMGKNIWRWYGWYDKYDHPDPNQVIKELDWNRWLGSLEKRPFNERHFWHWRCYWDYGTGIAGDLLSHEIDFVHSVLRHGIPSSCVCMGLNTLLHDDREVPDTWNTIYNFDEHDRQVTFMCSMNSAELGQPPEFRGKDAVLRFDQIAQSVSDFEVVPERKIPRYGDKIESGELKAGEPMLKFDPSKTEVPTHMDDFFNCVRSRKKTQCNEDEAFVEAATILMSVAAYKENRCVKWDKAKEDFV
ncbi:MAG: twin-arginine translocation signal domain-containing protein [bacterium]|nr:twin-arginine translocation signal domain-containing protein [bacterium]